MRWSPITSIGAALRARAVTLTAGLVLLALCVLLLADLVGLRDDGTSARQSAREAQAETLSLRLSLLFTENGVEAVRPVIERFVADDPNVDGAVLTLTGNGAPEAFGEIGVDGTASSERRAARIVLPILDRGQRRGELTLSLRTIDNAREDVAYFGFVTLSLLLVYLAYLGKVLMQLDPSRVIPERVDSAFNLLAEGVVVLDGRLRVLMANGAAAEILGKRSEQLVGGHVERWPWVREEGWQAPWETVLKTGLSITDHPVRVERLGETKSYTLSCSPIGDEEGASSGLMLTLTDLSAIERKNRELSSTLVKLRRSQESITEKNRELEALASQDPLTGLKNRRAVVEELALQFRLARDGGPPLTCIMVDIDHFKRINDTYGHATGDEVICAVANSLVDQGRKCDTVGRVGGEEFVVILPGTDPDAAMHVAERIRAGIEALGEDVTVPVDTLSTSLGVAAYESAVETLEALLDRADQALYTAKENGRNQAVLFDAQAMSAGDEETSVTGAKSAGDGTESARATALEKVLEEKSRALEDLRTFDPTTGLPKREVFVERVERGIDQAVRSGSRLALLSLGLRDSERLVASLGQEAYSRLLREFARRLGEGFRRADTISEVAGGHGLSHLGATEFGVLLENVSDAAEALSIMTRVRQLFAEPIVVDDTRVHVSGSIGVAFHPRDGDDAEGLIERAGSARSEAARQSGGTALRFADETSSAPTRESLEMESDLYEAVEQGQFDVHYQPKLSLATRRVVGMEALVRWDHPDKGWISPADFIPIAERNGLIEAISAFVTRTTLEQLAAWRRAGFTDVGVAMNVSATQLRDPQIAATLVGALEAAGVPSSLVEIELTETAVIESPQRARIALGQLRNAGLSVSMDDFGVGYTSLALLADLPLDSVKIDKGFVDAMIDNERSRAIVRSIIDMGRALGLSVIGEGVETNEQLELLTTFGCDEVQGYLISRPLDAAAMTSFLERQARDSRGGRLAA